MALIRHPPHRLHVPSMVPQPKHARALRRSLSCATQCCCGGREIGTLLVAEAPVLFAAVKVRVQATTKAEDEAIPPRVWQATLAIRLVKAVDEGVSAGDGGGHVGVSSFGAAWMSRMSCAPQRRAVACVRARAHTY